MPKAYPPAQKEEALRLLDLYDNKISTVQQLTGISHTTLCRWRDERFRNNPDLSVKKNIAIPEKLERMNDPPPHPYPPLPTDYPDDQAHDRLPSDPVVNCAPALSSERFQQHPPAQDDLPARESENLDSARQSEEEEEIDPQTAYLDSHIAGIPGKTYPYPLEDDDSESENNYEEFRKVRDILMKHAHHLAINLRPDDPDINRRSLALSRILDRVEQLDDMLPDLNPERVVRFEFVYDGMVHNRPQWMADHLGPDERAALKSRKTGNEESGRADP